jgi:uncharacterized membrane protein
MATCTNHNWIETETLCAACARPFCSNCLVPFMGQPHCGECRDRRLATMQGQPEVAPNAPLAGTGRVEIGRWVSEGWRMTRESGGIFVGAMLVAGLCSLLTLYICMPALICGLYMMAFQKITTGEMRFGTLFEGFRRFKNALLTGLVMFAVGVVLAVGVGLPLGAFANPLAGGESGSNVLFQVIVNVASIVIGGLTFFVFPHVAARNAGPMEAFAASWEVVKRNPLGFCAAYFVISLASSLGAILCGIGVLITLPILILANAQAYGDHFGLTGSESS